jgi:hypothetical protein
LSRQRRKEEQEDPSSRSNKRDEPKANSINTCESNKHMPNFTHLIVDRCDAQEREYNNKGGKDAKQKIVYIC